MLNFVTDFAAQFAQLQAPQLAAPAVSALPAAQPQPGGMLAVPGSALPDGACRWSIF